MLDNFSQTQVRSSRIGAISDLVGTRLSEPS